MINVDKLATWVDRSLASDSGRLAALPGLAVTLLGILLVQHDALALLGWAMIGLGALWFGFMVVRVWRLFKTGLIGSRSSDWVE